MEEERVHVCGKKHCVKEKCYTKSKRKGDYTCKIKDNFLFYPEIDMHRLL